MVFVYIGIAVVVLFLLFVLYYNRKKIIEKIKSSRSEKIKKKQPKAKVDPDTVVQTDGLSYEEFPDPKVKEYSDKDSIFTPSEKQKANFLDDLDRSDYYADFVDDDIFSGYFANFDEPQEEEEEMPGMADVMRQNISIGSHSLTNEKPSIHGDDYDEVVDDIDIGIENTSIAQRFANLPDDMKALMLADILNKKY